ncbi:MAG: hypothetical protein OEY51_14095 [Cyclobacteriaceae bacterium]|nr:hypothetical protein [Cyclobacteriaceae bacterium]
MNLSLFKSKVHRQCLTVLDERIDSINQSIHEIQQSAREDSKSSMGDKYETGRAMAHLEIEKLQSSLSNLVEMHHILTRIDPAEINKDIKAGTLLHTNHGWMYIATGLGKITIDGIEIMVISTSAPLIDTLKKVVAGSNREMNGQKVTIQEMV